MKAEHPTEKGGEAEPGAGTLHDNDDSVYSLLEDAADAAAPGRVDLPPGSVLNMELSHLAFNERVLELARDHRIPLLEKVRFVSIFGSNLDEFFITRVAGFKRQVAMKNEKPTLDGISPTEQLRLIDERTRELLRTVYDVIVPELSMELKEAGIEIISWNSVTDAERGYLRSHYTTEMDAVIYPVYVRSGAPFPHVRNLRPAFITRIRSDDGGGDDQIAILELPGDVPRLLPLPGGRRFVPLEEVIRFNLPRLTGSTDAVDAYLFRVTRSGNLTLDAENIEDIVAAVAENVALRPFQPVVRIEVEDSMPKWGREYLFENLNEEAESRLSHLSPQDLYSIRGPIDLGRLGILADLPIDALRFPPARRFSPLRRDCPVVDQLREEDVLVRFPRHSFESTVERFIHEAADDPLVEEIWITLYRTNRASRIVRLLRRAHRNGKSVTALIEVKASFDEQRNIEWARTLESAGIRVLYGPPSLKVHAKIACVVRNEDGTPTAYSFVGTGNLNAATASSYTDLGLLTADSETGRELVALFSTLAGDAETTEYRKLVVAPFNMRRTFLELIARETDHASAGRPAHISVKLNGIADKEIIAALYRANDAGVNIDLLVRGICAVRPAVPGLSERIRVVAIAGRYLEHSRIIRFENAGKPEYFIGSADWRGRNLTRRVEAATPILNPKHRVRLDRILQGALDHPDAWDLQPDGRYVRRRNAPEQIRPVPGSSALAGG
jgi:polyphosphate kinase